MKQIEEYGVVTVNAHLDDSVGVFQERVNQHIREGWQPYGIVQMLPATHGKDGEIIFTERWCQTMVRYFEAHSQGWPIAP